MEAEWENVKDQEMETVEEEKANFCSNDPQITQILSIGVCGVWGMQAVLPLRVRA